MKLPEKNRDYFFELETSLHRREIRNSAESVSELLADEFIEFGSSGRIFNKSSIIESLKKDKSDEPILVDNFNAHELAPAVVLVTYIANAAGQVATCTLRSSIWKLIAGRWQMVFHQGTRTASLPKKHRSRQPSPARGD
jgi:hypothetical protein